MAAAVKCLSADCRYDHVSAAYPGPVVHGHVVGEPHNLGPGWVGLDFRRAFGRPVKLINDAAMQALGSYRRGRMLFVGLGTGLGSAARRGSHGNALLGGFRLWNGARTARPKRAAGGRGH